MKKERFSALQGEVGIIWDLNFLPGAFFRPRMSQNRWWRGLCPDWLAALHMAL